MRINALSTAQHSSAPVRNAAPAASSFTDVMAQTAQSASDKFDFTNMTPTALHDTVGSLIRSGKLDLDETTGLVGMMNPTSPLNKVNYDGLPASSSNAPINVLDRLQDGIAAALARNETDTARSLQLARQALARYQA